MWPQKSHIYRLIWTQQSTRTITGGNHKDTHYKLRNTFIFQWYESLESLWVYLGMLLPQRECECVGTWSTPSHLLFGCISEENDFDTVGPLLYKLGPWVDIQLYTPNSLWVNHEPFGKGKAIQPHITRSLSEAVGGTSTSIPNKIEHCNIATLPKIIFLSYDWVDV